MEEDKGCVVIDGGYAHRVGGAASGLLSFPFPRT